MTGNTTRHWYRSVRIKMTPKQVAEYVPYHRGLDLNFYAPQFEDNRMRDMKKALNAVTYYDVTITASSINPNILHERSEHDIDEELAIMDSKFGVIRDHLSHTDNKNLIHNKQSKETLTKHGTILDHPYLDEHDRLRSTATEVHDIEIPMEEVKVLNKHFEKRKAFYKRQMLKDFEETKDPVTGEKKARMKFGYL